MSTILPSERILRELHELWITLGQEGQGETGAGVLRACSMTLMVLTDEADDVQALGETLAALMPEHPARVIVVRLRGGDRGALSERVYSQCWTPFGQRRQICCEQIEITVSDAGLGDLPPLLLPLTIPDLPVFVWCRSTRLPGMAEFHDFAALARRTVVDSTRFPDPKAALAWLAETAQGGLLIGDLAWTRITRWRAMISQVFEHREYLAKLPGVRTLELTFGGDYETLAWYLAAWVAGALADVGAPTETRVTRIPGANALRLKLAGEGLHVTLERQETRLSVGVNELTTCTNLPEPTAYVLMREELGIVRPDPVFSRTLASAARLAYATDK